ncbi:MAG: HEAT repeat domain-containing protein [Polyangiaceae bacterium]|nr:HEAT repeat domain-containing protein [Polyangiaceae bacterium]
MRSQLGKKMSETAARGAAERFLKRAGEEVQILLERGAGQWGFLHLTFQEFFVAAGLHANERFEEVALAHLLEPRWEEVIRLGVGYLALVQARPVAAQRFLEKVLDYEAPEPWRQAVKILGKHIGLAALLAVEAGEALPLRLQRRIADAFVAWICHGGASDARDGWIPMQARMVANVWLRQVALSDFAAPVAERFIHQLGQADPQARLQAARALEVMGTHVPCASIVEAMLLDPERSWTLGKLLSQNTSADELRSLSHHPDGHIRDAVAAATRHRPEPEQQHILANLANDPSEEVRLTIVDLLTGSSWQKEANRLSPFLRDPSSKVRLVVLLSLHQATDEATNPEVLSEVQRLLREDPDPNVRCRAAVHLASQGDFAGFQTAFDAFAQNLGAWDSDLASLMGWKNIAERVAFLDQELTSPNAKRRAVAAFLLGRWQRNLPFEAIPNQTERDAQMAALVGDPDPLVRTFTLRELDIRGEKSFAAATQATREADPQIRRLAYEAVGRRSVPVELLKPGLNDSEGSVRTFCLNVLGWLPPSEQLARLEAAAEDPDERVRSAAPRLLRLAPGDVQERLMRRLAADPSTDVRSAVAYAALNRDVPIFVDVLAPLVNDPSPGVVRAAAHALALGGDEGMRVLVEHADKPDARAALWTWAEARSWSFVSS